MNGLLVSYRDQIDRLGPALHLLRQRLNQPQRVVAHRAGITHATYAAYERGRKVPTFEILAKVLAALQADPGTLNEAILSMKRLAVPAPAAWSPGSSPDSGAPVRDRRPLRSLPPIPDDPAGGEA
jgi:transcriptional regulator with XRE-family HTH domain